MLGCGTAQVDHGGEPARIALQECDRVEPESREDRGTVEPIFTDQLWHQHALFLNVPEDLVRLDRAHDVLQHPARS